MQKTLTEPHELERTIKRSRFIARAGRCDDEPAAQRFIEAKSEADATHNCWAWQVGQVYRCEDDGEPGGTAGRPILNAITQQGFDHVAVVVVRYFGGIKLGAGGLARAYGGAAARCLQAANSTELVTLSRVLVRVPFEHSDLAHQLVPEHGGRVDAQQYNANGLELEVALPNARFNTFRKALRDASSGAADVTALDLESLRADPGAER